MSLFDGGFTVGGLVGNGDSFVFRDAHGIRPAYYYVNDEVVVALLGVLLSAQYLMLVRMRYGS